MRIFFSFFHDCYLCILIETKFLSNSVFLKIPTESMNYFLYHGDTHNTKRYMYVHIADQQHLSSKNLKYFWYISNITIYSNIQT